MSAKQLGVLLLLLLIVGGAVVVWKTGASTPEKRSSAAVETEPEKPKSDGEDDELQGLRKTAYELQEQGKWCEAKLAWEQVEAKLSGDSEHAASLEEARQNVRLLKPLCAPPTTPVTEHDIPPAPPEQRPEVVSEHDLLTFYPVGRTIQSIALVNADGEGTGRDWGLLRGESHFAYQYRIVVETEVIENRGTAVVFRQHFKDVSQLRAVSEETLELDLPDTPVLDTVWEQVEENWLNPFPTYRAIKKLGEITHLVDPHLKRTVTFFRDQLKRFGDVLDLGDEVEIVARVERLAGKRLEIEYVSGLGVTYIKVLDGEQFDPGDLERIAFNSGLLMDYFLSKSEKAQPGEPFEVRARDLGGMLTLGYDIEVDGELSFERTHADREADSVLKVVGGEVALEASVDGIDRTDHLKPITGTVRYSPRERLVRESRMVWQADSSWFSKDHLLFGAEGIRNLTLETYYEARTKPQSGLPEPTAK